MTLQVTGIEDIQNILEQIAPNKARNIMRATVHGVAGEVTKKSKAAAPKNTGNLKKAIKTKRKRSRPNMPTSTVNVTTGNSAKNDAFYWRFVEYGTQKTPAVPFIRPSIEAVNANLETILKEQFVKKFEAALRRAARQQGVSNGS